MVEKLDTEERQTKLVGTIRAKKRTGIGGMS